MPLSNELREKAEADLLKGTTPVDPKALEEYERAMDEAIPQIVDAVRRREELAHYARLGIQGLVNALETERTMHAAWRKRAEEAEAAYLALVPEDEDERTEEIWLSTLGGKRRGDWDFYFPIPDDDKARVRIYLCAGSGVWSGYIERVDRGHIVVTFGSVKTRGQVRQLLKALGIPIPVNAS